MELVQTTERLHVIQHNVVADAITALRRRETPTMGFRTHARLISRALAHEATREAPIECIRVETPVAAADGCRLSGRTIVAPILRAGLGMLDGFLDVIPHAATGFIGLRRDEQTLLPFEYYRNVPDPSGAHFFLLDPMLATGGSVLAALESFRLEEIASITLLSIIAAPEGVEAVLTAVPQLNLYVAALDERLNDRGYIVPGLGDAGDRLCNTL